MKCVIDFSNGSTSSISREATCSCGTLVRVIIEKNPTRANFFCPICGKPLTFSKSNIGLFKSENEKKLWEKDPTKEDTSSCQTTLSPSELAFIFQENFN